MFQFNLLARWFMEFPKHHQAIERAPSLSLEPAATHYKRLPILGEFYADAD
jgi:hypothetical protein